MNKYHALMQEIEVTPQMEAKILTSIAQRKPQKAVHLGFKRLATLAACLGCIAMMGLGISKSIAPPPIMVTPDIQSVATLEELSSIVGFEIEEDVSIPFIVDSIRYTSYRQEVAEVKYIAEDTSLTFRKSQGQDDNSGDYTNYPYTKDIHINGNAYTLKGTSLDRYQLALWKDSQYSFSMFLKDGFDEAHFLDLLQEPE